VRRGLRAASLAALVALATLLLAGTHPASAAKRPQILVTSSLEGPPIPGGQPLRGLVHLRVRSGGSGRLTAVFSGISKPPSDPFIRYRLGLSRLSCAELQADPGKVPIEAPGTEVVPDQFGNGAAYVDDTAIGPVPLSQLRAARSMVVTRGSQGTSATQLAACGSLAFWNADKSAAKGVRAGVVVGELGPQPGQTAQGLADFRVRLKVRRGPDRPIAVTGVVALLIGVQPFERVPLFTSGQSCPGAPLYTNGWVDQVSTIADSFGNALLSAPGITGTLQGARSVALFRNSQGAWLACGPLSTYAKVAKKQL
jgi:hypothetical protein